MMNWTQLVLFNSPDAINVVLKLHDQEQRSLNGISYSCEIIRTGFAFVTVHVALHNYGGKT